MQIEEQGRPTRERAEEVASCPCGSAWFRLAPNDGTGNIGPAVSVNGEGRVIAYAGALECVECGEAWEPGGSYLKLVK